ncbi:MAG TPA: polymer-forming cytoskeletal protein, partial [Opitutaceae bacterium]
MKTRFHQLALGASTTHAVACLALWLGAWLASPLAAQDTPEAAPVPPVVEQTGMEATDTPVEAAVPADDGAAAIEEAAPETPPVEAIEAPPPPAPPPVNRRELVTIGGDAHLLSNETSQEMVTILGNAIVDGHVQGECVTILGNVTVNGRVDGELVCIMGQVTLGPHAEIHGEVIAVGGRIDSAPGAVIHGERVELPFLGGASLPSFEWLGQWITEGVMLGRPLPHRQLWAWVAAGVLLLINLLFYLIFRRPVEASASAL